MSDMRVNGYFREPEENNKKIDERVQSEYTNSIYNAEGNNDGNQRVLKAPEVTKEKKVIDGKEVFIVTETESFYKDDDANKTIYNPPCQYVTDVNGQRYTDRDFVAKCLELDVDSKFLGLSKKYSKIVYENHYIDSVPKTTHKFKQFYKWDSQNNQFIYAKKVFLEGFSAAAGIM